MDLVLSPDIRLRPLTPDDAADVLAVLDADRSAFDPWLRWSSGVTTIDAARAFLAEAQEREAGGNGFHLGLRVDDRLVGGVVCWSIDRTTGDAELGYWLAPAMRGRGMAERATRAVMEHLRAEEAVRRIVFRCLVENAPSRALAERLGATLRGVQRPEVLINGCRRDHAVYVAEPG